MNNMKTTLLLATLTAILVVLGDMIGGRSGMMIMFIISMGMNFMSYWFSDKIVLAQYNAQQVTAQSNPKLYGMVERLAKMVIYLCQRYISFLVKYLMHLLQAEIRVMQQLLLQKVSNDY